MRHWLLFALIAACGAPPELVDDPPVVERPEDPFVPEDPASYHPALAELACSSNVVGCADQGPHIQGTCCTEGSALVHLSEGGGAEVVDLEVVDGVALMCGGFGARLDDVTDPGAPQSLSGATARCQRSTFGPTLPDGTRVFYLSHHGDTWVQTPFLQTFRLAPDGSVSGPLHDAQDTGDTLFEGVRWRSDWVLFAAIHGEGLQVWRTDAEGTPTSLVQTLGGFTNAAKVAIAGNLVVVTDDDVLQIVDALTPESAEIVASYSLEGKARDVVIEGDRAFVALGARGVEVVDLTDPTAPSQVALLPVIGSVQALDVDQGKIAIAAWSHVQLRDATTLQLLGTRKTRSYRDFEQDFGIALSGDTLFAGEWEGLQVLRYRPGYVGADLWVTQDLLSFEAESSDTRFLQLRNRGPLPLTVDLAADDPSFEPDPAELTLDPGELAIVEVHYTPPAPESSPKAMVLSTNDPDPEQASLPVPLYAADTGSLDVGDPLTDAFGFLDPTCSPNCGTEGDLANLEGKVVVLAYFALF